MGAHDRVEKQISIGQRNESSLHASLKAWYCQPGDIIEAEVEGFMIDVVRGSQLIEVQRGNFAGIKEKVSKLIENHPLLLVHPIAQCKELVYVEPDTGEVLRRRRSPKRGVVAHLFDELVSLPDAICHPNFAISVLLTVEEEIRCADGKGSWRRGGVSIKDRVLVEVLEEHLFQRPEDFLRFLPVDLPEPFSNRILAETSGLPLRLCRKISYCLRKMDVVETVGKQGNELLFAVKVG